MTQLYGRIFSQIHDSSIAENWQARMVFMDFLILADKGIVDVTKEAFSRRTNIPISVVTKAIAYLEQPDPRSRDSEEEGRRIVRLDEHRDWGWRIVNWQKYDSIRTQQDRRAWKADEMRRYRQNRAAKAVGETEEDTDTDTGGSATCSTTCRATPSQPVELPEWFPSETEAVTQASMVNIPEAFARSTWNLAAGRGGKDSKGQPIKRWQNYLSSQWSFNQSRSGENRYATTPGRRNGPNI
jgi:hypothetical protein